jgi:hypothetical protein
MGLNPVINQDNPMFEMLYRQCPSEVTDASRTFFFEMCDGTMKVVAELITDAQDSDVIGYVITEQVMEYETKAVELYKLK